MKLTTLSHPKLEMGVQAARMLIDMIERKTPETPKDIIYKPELVERNSTKALG
ncbi:Arabinose metabolism transcriptional repressor [compost metagenome]